MTENLFGIIGIEAITAAQGVDFRAPLTTSPELQKAIGALRGVVATLDVDRYMANDLAAAHALVASGAFNASVSTGILPMLEG
eukprot:gene40840-55197_t